LYFRGGKSPDHLYVKLNWNLPFAKLSPFFGKKIDAPSGRLHHNETTRYIVDYYRAEPARASFKRFCLSSLKYPGFRSSYFRAFPKK
jgi:hypothetical protein